MTKVYAGLLFLLLASSAGFAQEDAHAVRIRREFAIGLVRKATPINAVRMALGVPIVREVHAEDGHRREDLVYPKQFDDSLFLALSFTDGEFSGSTEVRSKRKPHKPNYELSPDELKRRGRISMIGLGMTAEGAKRWAEPDAVLTAEDARRTFPAWPDGEAWVYETGPYVSVFRVANGSVVQFIERTDGAWSSGPATSAANPLIRSAAKPADDPELVQRRKERREFWLNVLGAAIVGVAIANGGSDGSAPMIVATQETIESRISGEFKGWGGGTVFKLQNGMMWQQVTADYFYHYAYSPRVTLVRRGSNYEMFVEGTDRSVQVRQVR